MKDGLGVEIQVGDYVMLTAWGGAIPRYLVGITGKVTATNRRDGRPVIVWHPVNDGAKPGAAPRPEYVQVLNRESGVGFEGNRSR